MKIIYLTNGIYEQNILENNIQIINKKEKNNDSQDKNIIVYGGNQINSDKKIEEDVNMNLIAQLNKINNQFIKYILYGSLDLDIGTNCIGLTKSIEDYKKDKNFISVFGINYKLIGSKIIIIFLDNFFNITDNMDTNITSTCFKYLITLEPTKYKDNMSIRDLVELEINELSGIIKKNINLKTIIFMTQTPLVIADYINKKTNINNTLKYIELLNRYSYLLYDKNLYWICGDLKSRNENSIIKMVKKDNIGNNISEIIVQQYIIGLNSDSISGDKYGNISEEYNSQFEIGTGTGTGIDIELVDTKWQLDVNYKIDNVNKNIGYLEIDINNNNIDVKFIDINKIVDEKQLKLEELKKKIKTQNIYEPNILDNVELSISDSSNEYGDNQLTEEGDPYKSKYLKYKKKLYKLRNNKK